MPFNSEGCYHFNSLAPNVYRVTARVRGFNNVTHDKISITPGEVRKLDFNLSTSPICDCETPGTTLRQMAERAGAVVYLRITDHDSALPAPTGYFKQTGDVLEILKYHTRHQSPPFDASTKALHELSKNNSMFGPTRKFLTFLQDQSNGAPEPYEPGEEFVLFLHWWPSERIFEARTRHAMDRSDRDTVFVIQKGRVARTPSSLIRYVGAPIEALLAELRTISSSASP